MDIGPGDWVECVDNRTRVKGDNVERDLTVGAIYEVSRVGWSMMGTESIWLTSVACESWRGFYLDRFRPVYRPKEGAFDHMLEPKKELVK